MPSDPTPDHPDSTLAQDDALERELRRRVAETPADTRSHEALGRLLVARGKHDEACGILAEVAVRKPRHDVFSLLVTSQVATHRYAEAAQTFDRIFNLEPAPRTLLLWAKMKRLAGQAAESHLLLELGRSLFPDDVTILLEHANHLRRGDDDTAVLAALRAAAETPAFAQNLALLKDITVIQARHNRRRAGLNPYAAASWDDLHMWADPEGLARYRAMLDARLAAAPVSAEMILERAWVGLVDGAWDEAERLVAMVRAAKSGGIADPVHFGQDFYRDLAQVQDDEILAAFPPLENILSGPAAPALFLASDPVYFRKFTLPLLEQLGAHAPDLAVHVHLLDGTPEVWRECLDAATERTATVGMTAEASGVRREHAANYYHAARFVRFHEFLLRNRRQALMIDVDVTLTGDPFRAFAQCAGKDIGIYAAAQALDPWDKIKAACVGATPTGAGLNFTRLVAAYITHLHRAGACRWGSDQIALFGVYAFLARAGLAPQTCFFQTDIFGHESADPAVFRFTSGYRKYAL